MSLVSSPSLGFPNRPKPDILPMTETSVTLQLQRLCGPYCGGLGPTLWSNGLFKKYKAQGQNDTAVILPHKGTHSIIVPTPAKPETSPRPRGKN